jgi:transposase-like protein
MIKRSCHNCKHTGIDKGRAIDRRRAYRCQKCGAQWHEWQGSKKRYSPQRQGDQFADTGAYRRDYLSGMLEGLRNA